MGLFYQQTSDLPHEQEVYQQSMDVILTNSYEDDIDPQNEIL